MDNRLKQRLIGAFVLVVLAVIFGPYLMKKDSTRPTQPVASTAIPPRPPQESTDRGLTISLPTPPQPAPAQLEPQQPEPNPTVAPTPQPVPQVKTAVPPEPPQPIQRPETPTQAATPHVVPQHQVPPPKVEPAKPALEPVRPAPPQTVKTPPAKPTVEPDKPAPPQTVKTPPAKPTVEPDKPAPPQTVKTPPAKPTVPPKSPATAQPGQTPPPRTAKTEPPHTVPRARVEPLPNGDFPDFKPENPKSVQPPLPKVDLIGRSMAQPTNPAKLAAATPPPPVPPKPAPAQHSGWVIQIASFSLQQNASAQRDKLRAQGFNAFIESLRANEQTLYRVRVGPYSSRAESEQILSRLHRDAGISGGQIMSSK